MRPGAVEQTQLFHTSCMNRPNRKVDNVPLHSINWLMSCTMRAQGIITNPSGEFTPRVLVYGVFSHFLFHLDVEGEHHLFLDWRKWCARESNGKFLGESIYFMPAHTEPIGSFEYELSSSPALSCPVWLILSLCQGRCIVVVMKSAPFS